MGQGGLRSGLRAVCLCSRDVCARSGPPHVCPRLATAAATAAATEVVGAPIGVSAQTSPLEVDAGMEVPLFD